MDIEGASIRVATPETLVRMESHAVRPIDQADAAALERLYPEERG